MEQSYYNLIDQTKYLDKLLLSQKLQGILLVVIRDNIIDKTIKLLRKTIKTANTNLKHYSETVFIFEFRLKKYTFTEHILPPHNISNELEIIIPDCLNDEFIALQKEELELETKNNKLNFYLRRVFNCSENIADLYKLLPSCLHQYLPKLNQEKISLSDLEINQIKTNNQEGSDLVEQYMLTNLLYK